MLNNIAATLGGGVPVSLTDYESIATTTVGAGGAATVSFTGIAGTYSHLQVRATVRGSTGGNVNENLLMKFNGATTNYYQGHRLAGDGASAFATASSTSSSAYAGYVAGSGAASNVFGVTVIDILDYSNTNKNKTVRSIGGVDHNGSGLVLLGSALWINTAAITSIEMYNFGGNLGQYSSFALYGIK